MSAERTCRSRALGARAIGAWLLLPALALTVSACGSASKPGNGVDPASLTPASAPVYVGAQVRPSEPLRASASAVGRALTRQRDPYLGLLALIQTPGSPKLEFARDVRPWLGPQAGVFLGSMSGSGSGRSASAGIGDLLALLQRTLAGEPGASSAFPFSSAGVDGAVLLDASDTSKARSFLATQAQRAGARASSYRGVVYSATGSGVAFGFVKGLAVIGSEAALHAVIDTSLGAPALTSAGEYAKLASVAPAQALAHLFVNPAEALAGGASASAKARAGEANALELLAQLDGGRPLDASFGPSATSIAIDLDAPAQSALSSGGGLLAAAAAGATAVGELPAESWLGVG
ncbi:MAG TPA: DUF3352 domain-containing protein, partial [Solirubrobacteraceae bacterium]|nr:DUF3352 domain-containing protein [Solirubrobacteraceae bacterium]